MFDSIYESLLPVIYSIIEKLKLVHVYLFLLFSQSIILESWVRPKETSGLVVEIVMWPTNLSNGFWTIFSDLCGFLSFFVFENIWIH